MFNRIRITPIAPPLFLCLIHLVLWSGMLFCGTASISAENTRSDEPVPVRQERTLRIRNLLNHGISLYDHGHYAEAIAVFDSVIKIEPRLAEAFYRRAVARREMGDLSGAARDFDKTLSLDPGSARAYFGRGLVRQRSLDSGGAISDYSSAIGIDGAFEIAYFNRGSLYYRAKRHADAVHDFDQVLNLNPSNVQALNNRALAREGLADFAGAIADYTKALKLDPNLDVARQNLERLKASLVLKGGPTVEGIAIKSQHHILDFRGILWEWFDPRADATVKATRDYVNIGVRESHAVAPEVVTPRAVAAISGDFSFLIRVKAEPANDGEAAGLVVYGSSGRAVRLSRGEEDGASVVSMSVYDGLSETQRVSQPAFAHNILLRIARHGNRFTGWYCEDDMTWVKVGEVNCELPQAVLTGFEVINSSGSRLFRAEFSNATFTTDGP